MVIGLSFEFKVDFEAFILLRFEFKDFTIGDDFSDVDFHFIDILSLFHV